MEIKMREYNAYNRSKEIYAQKKTELTEILYYYMISCIYNDSFGMSHMLDELYDLVGARDHDTMLTLIENYPLDNN